MAASVMKGGGLSEIYVDDNSEVTRTAHKTVRKGGKDKHDKIGALSSRKLFGELDTNRKNREGREILKSEKKGGIPIGERRVFFEEESYDKEENKKGITTGVVVEKIIPSESKVDIFEDDKGEISEEVDPDLSKYIRGGWRDDTEEVEGPAGGMTGHQYQIYLKELEEKEEDTESRKCEEDMKNDPPLIFDMNLPWLRQYKNYPKPDKAPATLRIPFSEDDLPEHLVPEDRSFEIGPPIIEDFAYEIDDELARICQKYRDDTIDQKNEYDNFVDQQQEQDTIPASSPLRPQLQEQVSAASP
mmetsp:Transcript_16837/g.25339  ORF Transcript_16837/g.25339 Transcript_16837/m.25339 type:complete len:301 (-) Transcript_16837:350-1252(-)